MLRALEEALIRQLLGLLKTGDENDEIDMARFACNTILLHILVEFLRKHLDANDVYMMMW